MHNYPYIMLDIETLSLKVTAPVFAVAAFNQTGTDGFCLPVEFKHQRGKPDADGIIFWIQNDGSWIGDAGPDAWVAPGHIGTVLKQLHDETGDCDIWTRGPEFDIPRLAYMLGIEHYEFPWKYDRVQSVRTAERMTGPIGKNTHKHNPKADVLHDMKIVNRFYEIMDKIKELNL